MRIITLLLCAIGWASLQVPPQQVSPPPDVDVVSAKWSRNVVSTGASTRPAISSETIEKTGEVNSPILPQDPSPSLSKRRTLHEVYTYSAEIRNRGKNEIRALKFSYVFNDAVTHEERKRVRAVGEIKIRPGEKKAIRFKSPLSPPRVVNANAPNAASPFEELVIIECVLFTDGSLWTHPQAKAGLCDDLRAKP